MVGPLLGGKRKATFFRRWILYLDIFITNSNWLNNVQLLIFRFIPIYYNFSYKKQKLYCLCNIYTSVWIW